jgi:branched-subunit amino acid ABC-type transport system permease component
MIGAFVAFSVATVLEKNPAGFWIALIVAPLVVAAVGLVIERVLLAHLYQREHLMLILFTFGVGLVLNDLVKIVWGADFRSIMPPPLLSGAVSLGDISIPRYNFFLLILGPIVAVAMWLFVNKTKFGKISRAAAVDREMVGVLGINVSWVFAAAFVIGCFLAGLGGALVAPMTSIALGMDHSIIIEAFLIVTIGGLGNIWGALVGAIIFGVSQSLGLLVWPQYTVVFPYAAVVIILLIRPKGLLRSVW